MSSQHHDTQREARVRSGQQERADSLQYLKESLEWGDPSWTEGRDPLIFRPKDDEGWLRMVDYNLKRWRNGRNDAFTLWRKRRDQRGASDLELRLTVCAELGLSWHELDAARKKIVRRMCVCWNLPEAEWDANVRGLE